MDTLNNDYKDLIIISVGVSLLDPNKKISSKYAKLDFKTIEKRSDGNRERMKEEVTGLFNAYKPGKEFYDEFLQLGPGELTKRTKIAYSQEVDKLPAELSSLYLYYAHKAGYSYEEKKKEDFRKVIIQYAEKVKIPKEKIVLLSSDTADCYFCALCIKKYLEEKKPFFNDGSKPNLIVSEPVIIPGLKGEEGFIIREDEKEIHGLRELVKKASEHVKQAKAENKEVVINISGGFKGAVPFLTLLGMCYEDVKVFYLYEKSLNLVNLPKLPVAFDIFTWRNYRGFIEAIPHLKSDIAESILEILPPQIRGLFEKVDDKYILITLGEILKEKYREEKEGELTQYGRGYLLTEKIGNKTKREALRDCIDRWQYLWLGDLIPETVEHARGHAQRDLELLSQILYPILNREGVAFFGDEDRTDDNLLVLLASIWLHDLGHSGDHLECEIKDGIIKDGNQIKREIKGFPSLIRDIHHILSWYLIGKDEDELFKSKSNKKWVRDKSIFDDNLIDAIRQICLYHRGKMPALGNHKPFEHIGIEINEPLEKLTNDKVNLPLLGALLRMADAGEVQQERTISEEYEAMRVLQNNREIESLKKEERTFRKIVKATFSGDSSPSLPGYLKSLQEADIGDYTDENLDRVVDGYVRKFVQEEVPDSIDNGGWLLLRNWLSALNQYIFKKRQPAHFEKHKGISAVMYLLDRIDEENGRNKYHFKVLAIHKKGENEEKSKELIQNVEQVVLKDIHDEYEKIRAILNEHRIFFDSYYRMEEGLKSHPELVIIHL